MSGPFSVGDRVTWTAGGVQRIGTVVAVVSPTESPAGIYAPDVRDHRTYVVDVDGRRYWPRVALLTIAKEPSP